MKPDDLPVLKGKHVTLRPPVPQDIEARFQLGSDPEIHRLFGGSRDDFRPMKEDGARRWVERLRDHGHAWVIEIGTLVGEIRLDHVDPGARRASTRNH